MDRLKYLSADEDVRAIADLRQKDLNDRISEKNAAIAKEREKAKKREKELIKKAEKRELELKAKADAKKRESAKKMLIDGLSVEIISKYSGLSLDEINEIKKKVQ